MTSLIHIYTDETFTTLGGYIDPYPFSDVWWAIAAIYSDDNGFYVVDLYGDVFVYEPL